MRKSVRAVNSASAQLEQMPAAREVVNGQYTTTVARVCDVAPSGPPSRLVWYARRMVGRGGNCFPQGAPAGGYLDDFLLLQELGYGLEGCHGEGPAAHALVRVSEVRRQLLAGPSAFRFLAHGGEALAREVARRGRSAVLEVKQVAARRRALS